MKKLMYCLCIVTLVVIMPSACNNDSEAPEPAAELSLTKISRDGETALELIYDEGKLVRANVHNNFGVLSHYIIYEYNGEEIAELRRYDGEYSELVAITVFTLNNSGQIIKGENLDPDSDFEEVADVITFGYDASGRLTSRGIAALGQSVHLLDEFTYDDAGHRTQTKRTRYPDDPDEYVNYEIDYTPADKPLPDHWKDEVLLLMVPELDDMIWDMFHTSAHRKNFNTKGDLTTETRTDATERESNDSGYLTRQKLTRVALMGLSPKDEAEMTYEYIE